MSCRVSDLQSYQHGFKQIATLPQGKLKPIPVNRKDSYIYDFNFLRHLKKYIIYASIIYDRFIIVDEKVNKGNIVSSFCNCFGCMNPNFEGLRINYCYFYGTTIRCTPRGTLKPMNFYGRNKSIIQSEFLESTELIYISFQSDTLHKPYAIFLDHKEEKVVITIRGTLSIEDCITDIECDAMEVNITSMFFFLLIFLSDGRCWKEMGIRWKREMGAFRHATSGRNSST